MNILLVEDNSADANLLKELLAGEADVSEVSWVIDGYEALKYVYQQRRPDLILLDLGLPRISGYEVLKELKRQPEFSTIPVVILTASRNPLDGEQCAKFGADFFLSKPHNLKEYEELAHKLATMNFLPPAAKIV